MSSELVLRLKRQARQAVHTKTAALEATLRSIAAVDEAIERQLERRSQLEAEYRTARAECAKLFGSAQLTEMGVPVTPPKRVAR